ncbi:lytic transglycosylase domain-containing protein [Burkholderia cenocepacia]|uniref:lytic transglycosylase domain-containing protein n=1 Tax=Burkholderia cenocepacia TaxID=95486 RepID=UPI002238330F|nr:lytic transglycosylase domain-containing protein [Burkholderia cenocepacia]MCW5144297.1 lytic transglycosylase domain-containing protein [Burkholderia cenocepacia]
MGLLDALSTSSESDQVPAFGGGLMGMMANPNTAGLMGMAGALLQASGASRLPVTNGAALGMGLQGGMQGAQDAFAMQRQLMGLRMVQGLMAGNTNAAAAPTATQESVAPAPALVGSANVPGLSGISAGMGAYASSPQVAADSAASLYPTQAQATDSNVRRILNQGLGLSMMGVPSGMDYAKAQLQYDPSVQMALPTDVQRNAAAAYGNGTPEYQNALRGILTKDGIVSLRPGAPFVMNGKLVTTPGAAPAGYMNSYDNATGQWSVTPVAGGTEAVRGSSAAQAGGKAQYNLQQVWDPSANGGQGGFVFQSTANVADASNGGASTGAGAVPGFTPFQNAIRQVESGGNPMAVNPASGASGSMQTMGSTLTNPGFGVTPARDNSPAEKQRVGADYATAMQQRYGNDTDAAVAYNWGPQNADKWIAAGRPWKMLPTETQGFVGQVHAQMQNYNGAPAQGSPAMPQSAHPMAAQPPLGAQADATAQAKGQVDTMNASYKEARQARSTGQYALTMLDDMSNFAQTKSPVLANKLYYVQGIFSSDAQLFDKARDNLITQVSNSSGMSTDAARAIVDGAIPSYGMNPQAIQTGLGQIKAQVQMRMVKGDYLSDAYANGNAQAYNQRENQFDQVMTPTAAAIIKMPSGPARNQAIAAAKNNPQDAQALRWGLNVGLLR